MIKAQQKYSEEDKILSLKRQKMHQSLEWSRKQESCMKSQKTHEPLQVIIGLQSGRTSYRKGVN